MLSRRDFLSSSSAAMLGSAIPSGKPPNIILFLADDMGCHDLACVGANDLKTPNIDQLAHSGSRFTNWYAAAPVCAPSRAALLTGRYPVRAGLPNNGMALPENEVTVADCLRKLVTRRGLSVNGILALRLLPFPMREVSIAFSVFIQDASTTTPIAIIGASLKPSTITISGLIARKSSRMASTPPNCSLEKRWNSSVSIRPSRSFFTSLSTACTIPCTRLNVIAIVFDTCRKNERYMRQCSLP